MDLPAVLATMGEASITLAGFAPLVDLVVELDDETMKLRSDERGRVAIRLLHPGKTHIRVRPR